MAVDAMLAVKTINPRGEIKYPVKAVNILKAHGKSATESIYVKGYALNCTVASQGPFILLYPLPSFTVANANCSNDIAMKTKIMGAKIACLDMNLMKARMHLGVHITIDDPEQLEAIRKR
jgi:T-complex protein 1 subunit alpha